MLSTQLSFMLFSKYNLIPFNFQNEQTILLQFVLQSTKIQSQCVFIIEPLSIQLDLDTSYTNFRKL